jgi:secreted trypsin-like serine protease
MHQAQIQILPREQCNNAMLEARAREAGPAIAYAGAVFGLTERETEEVWAALIERVRQPMTPTMLCSGTYEGGRTSCSGDSGGPLVVPLDDGSYIQAGIVSWGLTGEGGQGCAENALFSAYMRTASYIDWMNQVIASNP